MASIIVYMPTILTAALSYTIAAKLAADWQNNNKDSFVERSRLSIEIGWLSGIASMLFFFFTLMSFLCSFSVIAQPPKQSVLWPLLL
ncbi:hypothetical protein P7H15_13810 [Paenibacillus larvae]|nr:hypothetical protein [Paenibacillus larvae]MDT2293697.1 hypothetical protein [Paenibacillus larvae]